MNDVPAGSEISAKWLASTETSLGLTRGFLIALRVEPDDWSFVIKTHALVEAAVAQLLTAALRDDRLAEFHSRIELSNETRGKIAIVKSLELLGAPHQAFIRKFSELRNLLVHRVENTSFTFAEYLPKLDKQQRKSFWNAIGGIFLASNSADGKGFVSLHLEDPRFLIWSSAVIVAVFAHQAKLKVAIAKERESIEREILDSFLNEQE